MSDTEPKTDDVVTSYEGRLAAILEWYAAAATATRDAAKALRDLQATQFAAMKKLGDSLPDGVWDSDVIGQMAETHEALATGLEEKIHALVLCLRDEARAMRAGNTVFAEVREKVS